MNLWSEHLNRSEEWMKEACSPDCVNFVNKIAKMNWDRYCSTSCSNTTMGQNDLDKKDSDGIYPGGHLMKYPIHVNPITGNCYSDPMCFPDTNADVLGKLSYTLPYGPTV